MMQKRIGALLLALLMLLSLLTGCGSSEDTADDTTTDDTSTSDDSTTLTEVPEEAKEDPVAYITDGAMTRDDVVMTIGDTEVTAADYAYWLAYQYTYISYIYAQYSTTLDLTAATDEDGTTVAQSLGAQAASAVQTNTLLRVRAEEAGLTLTEDQETSMAELADNYDENTLLYYATDLETLQAAYYDSCLATNLEDYLFGEGGEMAPTEETLADYAEENGIYTCRYILLSTSDLEEDDEDGRAEQLTLAEDLLAQLQACSADELEDTFATLQTEYNYDGNTDSYTFSDSDSLVDGFREVVADLEVGQLGLTEETDYGYFVLLRLENDSETISEDYASDTYNSLISQWLEETTITTTDAYDNLDLDTTYSRLAALQDVLYTVMSASDEETEDTDTTTEDTEDADTTDETEDTAEDTESTDDTEDADAEEAVG